MFFPVLQSLRIKEDIDDNPKPVCLSCFKNLKDIDTINKWEIVILKANLNNKDNTAMSILSLTDPQSKYSKLKCYIIIDEIYYVKNAKFKVAHETRMLIAVHEFMHFLSYIYARIHNTLTTFMKISEERLSKKINILYKDTLELYKFFNEIRLIDDFTNLEQTRDKHFRLEKDDPPLNYTELYRNLMLSHQLFNKYFLKDGKDNFSRLWKEQKYGEASDYYTSIARRVAQEEWIPEKFAIYQAFEILNKYYAYSII